MKIYITKYVLKTSYIPEVEGDFVVDSKGKLNINKVKVVLYGKERIISKPYFYINKDDAIEHAKSLRDKEVKELAFCIKALERLNIITCPYKGEISHEKINS